MVSIHVDIEEAEWTPGIPFYGPAARYDGKDIVQLKVLSDRRAEAAGSRGSANSRRRRASLSRSSRPPFPTSMSSISKAAARQNRAPRRAPRAATR